MIARVAQLSDTHIVAGGTLFFGRDTSHYLHLSLDAVHALDPLPDYIVVTGDLANLGTVPEYERFRDIMATARVPYFVIPGNHDDRDVMRATLPEACYAATRAPRVRYAVDDFPIRLIGMDFNGRRPWPGATTDEESLEWLETTLAAGAGRPTILAVHQPPFRTGLHYLDLGGFIGSTTFRNIVDRHAHVRAVISGHVHCSRQKRWKHSLASTAPSTAPQTIPLLFMRGKIVGAERERPGFVVHDVEADATYVRTEFRLDDGETYRAITA